jgi:hypothetical protein
MLIMPAATVATAEYPIKYTPASKGDFPSSNSACCGTYTKTTLKGAPMTKEVLKFY